MSLTWLHLANTEFGDAESDPDVRRALVDAVRRERSQGWSADLIFVAGDVAHTGVAADYQSATAFFDELLVASGLARDGEALRARL